jgi:transposase
MSSVAVFVGLDYHQDVIQVSVLDPGGRELAAKRCGNSVEAVRQAVLAAGGASVAGVALEACGGSADFGQKLRAATGWAVTLGHAGYMHRLKGAPDKTDYADARFAADLLRVGYLPRVWLAPEAIRQLRYLVHYRQDLVDRRRALKLQVGGLLREHGVKLDGANRWTKRWIAAVRALALAEPVRWLLEALLAQIDQVAELIVSAEAQLARQTAGQELLDRLQQIEGIGPVCSWWLLAAIGDFARFRNGKQLARYCGLSPRNASSGNKQADGGLVQAADKRLRAALIQAAHQLVRRDARWGQLYRRLAGQGKPASVAVAAVANRWVRSMHHRLVRPEVAGPSAAAGPPAGSGT